VKFLTKKEKTMIHPNSKQAYKEEKTKLGKRAQMIYDFLTNIEKPMTDRQVQIALGFPEPNNVRPRITELMDEGLVFECGKVKCEITNKQVRLVSGMICHYDYYFLTQLEKSIEKELLNEGR
jgi:hypothetical protein